MPDAVAPARPARTWAVVVVIVVVFTWFFAQPYFVLGQVRDAARRGDRDALADLVDFPRLRDNRTVAAFLTPSGIAELCRGQRPDWTGHRARADSYGGATLRQGYVNPFLFHATVIPDSGGTSGVVFVLRRRGLSWVLTDIQLPTEPPASERMVQPPIADHRPTTPRQAEESAPPATDHDEERQASTETRTGRDGPGVTTGKHLPGPNEYVYVDELPEAIERVAPEYPDAARESSIEGMVVVKALVGTDGMVKNAMVVQSVPALDDAALAAVRKWRFKPAMTGGSPVAVWVAVPVRFSLH